MTLEKFTVRVGNKGIKVVKDVYRALGDLGYETSENFVPLGGCNHVYSFGVDQDGGIEWEDEYNHWSSFLSYEERSIDEVFKMLGDKGVELVQITPLQALEAFKGGDNVKYKPKIENKWLTMSQHTPLWVLLDETTEFKITKQ